MNDIDPSLPAAVAALARKAAEAILDIYGQSSDPPLEVTRKADRSPLTLADMRSHDIIVEGLRALTPDLPVLSEEGSDIAFEKRQRWQRYWLVDPLDGTREFVSRNGEFTVNIALIDSHAPVLGVVHVPVTQTTYTGVPGEDAGARRASMRDSLQGAPCGAFRQVGNGRAEPIRVRSPAARPLRIVGSRSHRGDTLERYLPQFEPYELVAVGSSIKFCLVAEGSADFYPRFGPTSEWDTAAAQAVVEAAGGAVVDLGGSPLRYNTKAGLLNPHFLVFGDRSRDWLGTLATRG